MIFASTSCLKIPAGKKRELFRVLDTYEKLGIRNIELGSMHPEIKDLSPLLKYKQKKDFTFIVHGFFPPAGKPFFINLASQNPARLKESIDFTSKAIDFCRRIDAKLYGLHSGYLVDWQEDSPYVNRQFSDEIYDKEKAFKTLEENVYLLTDYASKYGIKLALENNGGMTSKGKVVSMMHNDKDFLRLFDKVKAKNLGMLIDIGHLKTASKMFNFSYSNAIKKLQKKTFELHVHQNNGTKDEHKPLTDTKWLDDFDKSVLKKACVTIESSNMKADEIKDKILLLESYIRNRK